MRWLGIVILYYPDEEIEENICSYLDIIDTLIVWENTPFPTRHNVWNNPRIIPMGIGRNVGIGLPLNEAVKFAMENGFTHLLTMDQDSAFLLGHAKKYRMKVSTDPVLQNIVCVPNYRVGDRQWFSLDEAIEVVDSFMTSGTLYPVSLFKQVGMFREEFFVDSIDWEFASRIVRHEVLIYALHGVVLRHGAGYQRKKRNFFGRTVFPNEYSAIRSYYMIRNAVIVFREFPDKQKQHDYFHYWFYKRIVFVLLYESDKFNKLKGLLVGLYHGMKGIVGEQNLFK